MKPAQAMRSFFNIWDKSLYHWYNKVILLTHGNAKILLGVPGLEIPLSLDPFLHLYN